MIVVEITNYHLFQVSPDINTEITSTLELTYSALEKSQYKNTDFLFIRKEMVVRSTNTV